MTHLVIHSNPNIREKYLLKLASYLLERELKYKELISLPDVHYIKTDEKSIGIEEIKMMQKEMMYQPYSEKYQLCIFFDCQKLTHEAQNALLKTLEEQPETTAYILLLDDEKNLLDTILSRGIKHFVKEKVEEEEEITKPSILSLTLIEKFKKVEEWNELSNQEIVENLKKIQLYFRSVLHERMKSDLDVEDIKHNIGVVDTAAERLQGNGNKKLVLENMFIQLRR